MRGKEEKIRESVLRVVTSEDIVVWWEDPRITWKGQEIHPHEMRITDDNRMQPRIDPTS